MSAGLDAARGNAAIIQDANLQALPALIQTMLSAWREGYGVVNMKRLKREGETRFRVFSPYYQSPPRSAFNYFRLTTPGLIAGYSLP